MNSIEALDGRISMSDTQLEFNRFKHPIKFGTPQVFHHEGFIMRPFEFTDINALKRKGRKYEIEPSASSPIVRYANPYIYITEMPISGSGFLVRSTRSGLVESYQFSKEILRTRGFEMTWPDTDAAVWISNWSECPDEPFCVAKIVALPFKLEDEVILDPWRKDTGLPYEFLQQYDVLMSDAKPWFPFTPLPTK
jgi:hypothetical protein